MKNKEGFVNIAIIFGLVFIVAVAGYFAFGPKLNTKQNLAACTLEAKVCPDGSAVGRSGPNCEFAVCPDVALNNTSTDSGNRPRIVDYFACSDYCPEPRENYMIKIYEGVTDETVCNSLGGVIYTYYGWGKFTVCKAQ